MAASDQRDSSISSSGLRRSWWPGFGWSAMRRVMAGLALAEENGAPGADEIEEVGCRRRLEGKDLAAPRD